MVKLAFQYDDGGRAVAGFRGEAGDCAVRAAAIASGQPYGQLYARLVELAKRERKGKRKRTVSHPRTGVFTATMKLLMAELGFEWVPTMGIGTGCRVHLADGELPDGTLVVLVSKHFTAVVGGVIRDTHDPRRTTYEVGRKDGVDYKRTYDRCVYGFWRKL